MGDTQSSLTEDQLQQLNDIENEDENPNQVIYDLENNKVIIPKSEDDVLYEETKSLPKIIVRDVSNTRYRNSR